MSKSSKDLLSFLFLESAEADAAELNIEENLEQLFEAAAEAESGDLESKKTPLAKALGQFGISDADLVLDPEGFSLTTDNRQRYEDAITVLGTADAMHKLAEMGWVVTKPGDPAMGNEPAQYRIRFLEITTVDANDREPKGGTYDTANREEVIKKAQKFASTPMDRDDELNPVEGETGKPDKLEKSTKRTGVGDPKDGKDPEGKPKGAEKAIKDALEVGDVDALLEMTTTGSMGTVDAGPQFTPAEGVVKKAKPYSKGGTKFHTPGQWKVKQPIVNKMVKKHPVSEGEPLLMMQVKAEELARQMFGVGYQELLPAQQQQIESMVQRNLATEAGDHCPHEMNAAEFLKDPIPGEEPPK